MFFVVGILPHSISGHGNMVMENPLDILKHATGNSLVKEAHVHHSHPLEGGGVVQHII